MSQKNNITNLIKEFTEKHCGKCKSYVFCAGEMVLSCKEFNKFCVKVPYSNYKKFLEVSNKLCYNIIVNKYTGLIKILKFFNVEIHYVASVIKELSFHFVSNGVAYPN